ncbi:MAG: hypothetical protein WAK18_09750, partial [Nocardioidaceae bacterium]
MTDQPGNAQRGLSIFDNAEDERTTSQSADPEEATQVIPVVPSGQDSGSQSSGAVSRISFPTQSAQPPSFPVVRRGGYDKDSVDQFFARVQVSQVEGSSALVLLREENARLSARVEELVRQVAEQETPTYSGLGAHA